MIMALIIDVVAATATVPVDVDVDVVIDSPFVSGKNKIVWQINVSMLNANNNNAH